MNYSDNKYLVDSLKTAELFRAADLPAPASDEYFVERVGTWLEAVASSWNSFLPDSAISVMVPEVVGNLAEATFEKWNDVLSTDDCRD